MHRFDIFAPNFPLKACKSVKVVGVTRVNEFRSGDTLAHWSPLEVLGRGKFAMFWPDSCDP